jgi:hypothetical protein
VNLEFGAINSRTWKQIKLQHLMLMGGLALAVSAFVALGGLGAREGDRQTTSARPVSASMTAPRWQPSSPVEVIYYLVDSEAGALAVESAIAQSGAEQFEGTLQGPLDGVHQNRGAGGYNYVINASSTEGQLAADNLFAAHSEIATQTGVFLMVVDLRDR